MTTTTKIPTSLRAFADHRAAEAKAGESVQQLSRPRVFAINPLEIVVYPERNIRPIEPATVAQYKAAFIRGDVFPPIDVALENGQIVLEHGYHRTLAAQELVRENKDMAHLQLEMREFKGNASDRIVMMLNAQDALPVDPVSRAEAYHTLIKQGMPVAKIADRVGKTPEHVSQQQVLVEADELVKQAIRANKVSATAVMGLILDEKQGGPAHGKVVAEMISNAEAAGKPRATLKHRGASVPGSSHKLTVKSVRTSLKSLGEISGSLRQALNGYSVPAEGEADKAVMVELSLPAAKVAELLKLLEAGESQSQEGQQSQDSQQS